ncbi:uncharacterized protein BDZ83DRAFT_657094 [Colletotrichum acutatum]|uniref:Uncharacterized protein n=1 Tax=Glomerella acutata TaxID=27357 RepID=A0AAD8X8W0_GLOAC|nr:uncharacterized protein BDZ83DRAFT_657094 [Colletotrichum acutatum]KAK1710324.1 hypothetical protein BDZ83DRAFT_657094 [Colletotrichum acutatum]
MTNKGLRLESRVFTHGEDVHFLSLGLPKDGKSKYEFLGILFHELNSGSFVRTRPDELRVRGTSSNNRRLDKSVLFIAKQFTPDFLKEVVRIPGRDFKICIDDKKPTLMVRSASSAHHWDKYMNTFVSRDFWEFEGCLEVGTGSERKFDVVCGFDTQYGTWVYPNPASKNWRRGGNDLQADMPPLHEIKVVEGTQDGIPTTFVHLNRIKPVAQAPSKTDPSLQPKSVKQADEEGPADGNEISKKQKSNCKQM